MLSAWLGSKKHKFVHHWVDSTRVKTCELWIPQSPKTGDGCSTHSAIMSGCVCHLFGLCRSCDIYGSLLRWRMPNVHIRTPSTTTGRRGSGNWLRHVGTGSAITNSILKLTSWGFKSKQHVWSYQDRYRLVTVRTCGDFIVLSHWEMRPLAPWPNFPYGHIILILCANQFFVLS